MALQQLTLPLLRFHEIIIYIGDYSFILAVARERLIVKPPFQVSWSSRSAVPTTIPGDSARKNMLTDVQRTMKNVTAMERRVLNGAT